MKKLTSFKIDQDLIDYLKKVGSGNMTTGLLIVIEFYKKLGEKCD